MASFDLSGRTAVVTGGGRGLGRGIALALADAGADVALAARSGPQLDSVAAEVRARGRRAWCVTADLAEPRTTGALADRLAATCGPLHVVVHAAGTQLRKPAVELTVDDWDAVVAVNLTSPFFLSCRLAERMHADDVAGRHVFVSSLTASIGIAGIAPYSATKSGLLGVVRTLAVEWAATGTTVNAVQPGYFATELTADLLADPVRRDWVLSRIPMGQLGEPDDVGGAVVYLASDAGRYVTGQSVTVDGGWLAS